MPAPAISQPSSYLTQSVFNAMFPKEGAKVIPVPLNFSLQTTYNVDLTLLKQQGFINSLQTVFVDNGLNSAAVTIQVSGSNQIIRCPAGSQGVYPIFVPSNPQFTIFSSGAVNVPVFFTNVPLPLNVWSSSGTFSFNSSGYLETTDVALDATVVNGAVNTNNQVTGDNGTQLPQSIGNHRQVQAATASGNTAVIAAQGAGVGWFITDYSITLSPDAAIGSAGEFTVELQDAGNSNAVIAEAVAVLPTSSASGTLGPIIMDQRSGIYYNSKGTNAALNANLSVALTSGKCLVTVGWGKTTIVE